MPAVGRLWPSDNDDDSHEDDVDAYEDDEDDGLDDGFDGESESVWPATALHIQFPHSLIFHLQAPSILSVKPTQPKKVE